MPGSAQQIPDPGTSTQKAFRFRGHSRRLLDPATSLRARDLLDELARDPETRSGAALLMRYITTVLGEERAEELRARLAELAPSAEQAMQSIADAFERKGHEKGLVEGREKGLVEGLAEGQKSFLQRQLTRKFGPLSDDVLARLNEASEEELATYAERILDAERIQDVLE